MSGARGVLAGTVRDLVSSGEGVVETTHGLYFVRGVIPGESLLLRPFEKQGRVRRAALVRITAPSAVRVEAPCRHAARCGGCPLMHLTLAAQRELKQRMLHEALRKAGADATLTVERVDATLTEGYRRRGRLAFRAGKSGLLGFRREHTREVIDVNHCLVLGPVLDRALTSLRATLLPCLVGEGELLLCLGQRGGAVAVVHSPGPQPRAAYAACEELVALGELEGAAISAGGASVPAQIGEPTAGSRALDGQPLIGTLGGFSQAHDEINRALTERVLSLAEADGQRVLELYAGHGNFTVMLAARAQSLVAVEQDAAALRACRQNLEARGLHAKLFEGDVTRHLGTGPLDVVVLDPPRGGAPGVLSALRERKPKRIVYVSCDPATLGRDLHEAWHDSGKARYRLDHAATFEMFPHTADLEAVVRLVRV